MRSGILGPPGRRAFTRGVARVLVVSCVASLQPAAVLAAPVRASSPQRPWRWLAVPRAVPTTKLLADALAAGWIEPLEAWDPATNARPVVAANSGAALEPWRGYALFAAAPAELIFALLKNGVYQLRLTATDTAGLTSQVSVTVVVTDAQKVGHFSLSFVDLELPLAGPPIQITRAINSARSR